jgi:hypothetical protein
MALAHFRQPVPSFVDAHQPFRIPDLAVVAVSYIVKLGRDVPLLVQIRYPRILEWLDGVLDAIFGEKEDPESDAAA